MPDNQMAFPDYDVLKSIKEMRDFQREVLAFIEENQEQKERMLAFISVAEKFFKELEARMRERDRAVEPSERSWNHLMPPDLELGIGDLDPDYDLHVPGDVSGTAICPGSCGRPQFYCTFFEQPVGQYHPSAGSGFLEPTTSQQDQSVSTQPISLYTLTSSFGDSTIFGGDTYIEESPRASSSGCVFDLNQRALSSGDPFFQHFQQIVAELGPRAQDSSRFFPTNTVDEAVDTASGSQSASQYCEDSDEPCDLALSDVGDDDMGQHNYKGSEYGAETTQVQTIFTLFQHPFLAGSLMPCDRETGRLREMLPPL